ncbi:General stress protein 69 [Paenibacillus konkukensis]|uniref:General stress protein 69 n=1 Tax=Paenibacillus konkukensis TaxID=2020716 RepID=A0ABY4RQ27_9BACL|nr:aldo/keto reductase [Paenibacillus konkukensis]UQZ84213.1 General stress protein 69 [Paenibacillus konkukensis]
MSAIGEERMEQIRGALAKRKLRLPGGAELPVLGQGTWRIGDDPARRNEEIRALRLGVELGMNLIDTAEMYGDGKSEALVGEAVEGIRDSVFLVSKVYPHNAGRDRIARSCEQSLKRLKTDRLDLYLLHWRGSIPLEETIEGMERLVEAGKIRRWGVSNFDKDDMLELTRLARGTHCAINQVLYHLGSRGIEYDLLPWQRERGMPMMAYSPLAQAGALRKGLIHNKAVADIAAKRRISPLQLLLAWCIREDHVLAIPKAATERHVIENAEAVLVELTDEELAALDGQFPKPVRKLPLDIV